MPLESVDTRFLARLRAVAELCGVPGVVPGPGSRLGTLSLLRGLSVSLSAIPERFSSSSLPPSFAQGRREAVFTPAAIGSADGGPLIGPQYAVRA